MTESQIKGPYNEYFKNCMEKCLGNNVIERLRKYAEENNCTLLFEVVDMVNDPHIVEYPEDYNVFLLDIVKNDIEFSKLPCEELKAFAKEQGLNVKTLVYTLDSLEKIFFFVDKVLYNNFNDVLRYTEGFVFEDANGFMFKLKTPFYAFWKQMRNIAGSVVKYGEYKHIGRFNDNEDALMFYDWLMKNKDNPEIRKLVSENRIIALRKLLENSGNYVEKI